MFENEIPTGTETILVVEDEPAIRTLVQRALSRLGYQILCASSADEALAVADSHDAPIHLILSDVIMPSTSGPDIVRRLRHRFRANKAIFMSGYTRQMLVKTGALRSDDEFVQKPFASGALARRIREVLDA